MATKRKLQTQIEPPSQSKRRHNVNKMHDPKSHRNGSEQELYKIDFGEMYIEEDKVRRMKTGKGNKHGGNELRLRVYLKINKNNGTLSKLLGNQRVIQSKVSINSNQNKSRVKYDKQKPYTPKGKSALKIKSEKTLSRLFPFITKKNDKDRKQSKFNPDYTPSTSSESILQSESEQSSHKTVSPGKEKINKPNQKKKAPDSQSESKISVTSQGEKSSHKSILKKDSIEKVPLNNNRTIKRKQQMQTVKPNPPENTQLKQQQKIKEPSLEIVPSDKRRANKQNQNKKEPDNKSESKISVTSRGDKSSHESVIKKASSESKEPSLKMVPSGKEQTQKQNQNKKEPYNKSESNISVTSQGGEPGHKSILKKASSEKVHPNYNRTIKQNQQPMQTDMKHKPLERTQSKHQNKITEPSPKMVPTNKGEANKQTQNKKAPDSQPDSKISITSQKSIKKKASSEKVLPMQTDVKHKPSENTQFKHRYKIIEPSPRITQTNQGQTNGKNKNKKGLESQSKSQISVTSKDQKSGSKSITKKDSLKMVGPNKNSATKQKQMRTDVKDSPQEKSQLKHQKQKKESIWNKITSDKKNVEVQKEKNLRRPNRKKT